MLTFVVRLPQFPTGTIISAKQHVYEICSATSRTNAVDLESGQSAALDAEDLRNAQLLGARSEAKQTVLVSIDADEAHLLESRDLRHSFLPSKGPRMFVKTTKVKKYRS